MALQNNPNIDNGVYNYDARPSGIDRDIYHCQIWKHHKVKDYISDHKREFIIAAIAIGTLALLGAALLAYMHFGGLGISAAGFTSLGNQAFALMSTKQALYKVLIPMLLGSVLVASLAWKGKRIKEAIKDKFPKSRRDPHIEECR